eukprot:TRINITY_DN1207_c0_g1_i3.p1 TRINITY_DN1207_c0_g1~~TRINITY_DN1207_c0_g1_i3.p1  ORF type:complete len:207 (+),score=54.20 TRINITY_DN1207_c0_g1_i3:283-903(+)
MCAERAAVKAFKKMGFAVPADEVAAVCEARPGAIERVMHIVRAKINAILGGGGVPHRGAARSAVPPTQRIHNNGMKPPRHHPSTQPVPRRRMPAGGAGRLQPLSADPPQPSPGPRRPTYPAGKSQRKLQPTAPVAPPTEQLHQRTQEVHEPVEMIMQEMMQQEGAVHSEVMELRQGMMMLQNKVARLEQLLQLKDQKIASLLQARG